MRVAHLPCFESGFYFCFWAAFTVGVASAARSPNANVALLAGQLERLLAHGHARGHDKRHGDKQLSQCTHKTTLSRFDYSLSTVIFTSLSWMVMVGKLLTACNGSSLLVAK